MAAGRFVFQKFISGVARSGRSLSARASSAGPLKQGG
ncbi:unnamed protein product [Urochloa humidicola]